MTYDALKALASELNAQACDADAEAELVAPFHAQEERERMAQRYREHAASFRRTAEKYRRRSEGQGAQP